MELHEANSILRSVKSALSADGIKLPPSADVDGLMMLLDRLNCDKFLAAKIKHARAVSPDSSAYKRAYWYIAFFRALQAVKNGIADPVTSVSFMLLHKNICGDIDAEAGKPRTTEMLTDGSAHTDAKYITGSIKSIVAKMNETASSPTISKEDFAGHLTHYMREFLILHPFERGSEFAVRIFMMVFCKIKGFSLNYHRSPASAIKTAESTAFSADDVTPLYKILVNCLSYERTAVQSAQARPAPQTRRESISNINIRRAAQKQKPADEYAATKTPRIPKQNNKVNADDILKRAIRLQQKISKLNEQLTELIQPLNADQKPNDRQNKPK